MRFSKPTYIIEDCIPIVGMQSFFIYIYYRFFPLFSMMQWKSESRAIRQECKSVWLHVHCCNVLSDWSLSLPRITFSSVNSSCLANLHLIYNLRARLRARAIQLSRKKNNAIRWIQFGFHLTDWWKSASHWMPKSAYNRAIVCEGTNFQCMCAFSFGIYGKKRCFPFLEDLFGFLSECDGSSFALVSIAVYGGEHQIQIV